MSETNPTRRLKIKGVFYDIKDAVARTLIGNLSQLVTTAKNSLVDAINEVAQSGGGGTSDYTDLSNKPSINSVTLVGNKSLGDLGALPKPSSASNNDVLTYRAAQDAWIAAPPSGGGGGEVSVFWADYGTTTSAEIEDAYNDEMLVVATYYNRIYVLSSYDELTHMAGFTAVDDVSVYYLYCDNDMWSTYYIDIGNYIKPNAGIPKSDLSSTVQASLDKADSALQTTQGVSHAGEFLVVGSDGNITTMTLATWQGGSY